MVNDTTVSFGPVDCIQTCPQWKAPVTGQTVRSLMGLEADEVFDIDFSGALDIQTYAKYIPTKLGINSNDTLLVSEGLLGSPNTLLTSAWAKFYSVKVDPKTGVVKITIKVTGRIGGTVAKPKNLIRSVTFNGVMFQLLAEQLATASFVGGYTYTPPLPPATTGSYGEFAFNGPITIDENYRKAQGIAGTYRFKVKLSTSVGSRPSYTPANGATITATISADLTTITYNNRKIGLTSGGLQTLPADLLYSNAQSSVFSNQTVNVKINPITFEVMVFNAIFIKNVVGIPPRVSNWVYLVDGPITKLP